jgi:hypothetical protein
MTETDNAQIMQRRQNVLVVSVPSQVTGGCPQPIFAELYCHGKAYVDGARFLAWTLRTSASPDLLLVPQRGRLNFETN